MPDAIGPRQPSRTRPDAHGVYWYRDPGIPGIPAAWMAGGEQQTDEHWDRMNAELERLPPP